MLLNAGYSAKFKIMDAKFHAAIVTLSTKDNINLTKKLSDGFKRSIYWNKYQTILAKGLNQGTGIRKYLVHHFKVLKDYLFLLILLLQMIQIMK